MINKGYLHFHICYAVKEKGCIFSGHTTTWNIIICENNTNNCNATQFIEGMFLVLSTLIYLGNHFPQILCSGP